MSAHSYRVYVLNQTGHVVKRYDLEDLADDAFAMAEAGALIGDQDYEVWDMARLVKRVAARRAFTDGAADNCQL
jgi:hypothetical protein